MFKRILLAEDDPAMAQLLTDTLSREGYEVISAANGIELLESVEDFRHHVINGRFFDVDLIVSDIRMPWMSGLEMLRELRLLDKVTPVLLITAFGDEQTHHEAARLGACVLDKPFELDKFMEAVRQHLDDDSGCEEVHSDRATGTCGMG